MPVAAAYIEVRYRRDDSPDAWKYLKIPPTQGIVELKDAERGVLYQIEARSVAASGAASVWVQQTHTVSLVSVEPLAVSALAATSLADGVHLAWTVADTQRSDVEYEVQRTADLAGAPDPAGWTTINRVRTLAYTDGVTDGVVRWYRVRSTTYGGLTTAFSPSVNSRGKTVADGATVGATIGPGGNVTGAVDANGRALIDMSQGHLNKNIGNIADTSTLVRPTYQQIKQAHGVFLETFESAITGGVFAWIQVGSETGTGITYPSDGQAGGKALAHSAAGKDCWFVFPQIIPFDPSKMYRIRARARKTANVNNTFLFVGVEGIAADGATLINVSGLNTHGSQHYVCANAVNTPVSSNWTEYTGYFKGWGTYAPSSNPNTPSPLTTGIHYFRPLFILNETSGAGNGGDSWELDYIAIDIMPDSTDNIADGTGSPLTGGKRGFTAIDNLNIVVATGLDFSRGYTGKHLGNIPDDATSNRRAATANQLTGGTRAFSNINSDNTYQTIPYHGSAFRRQTATSEGGSDTGPAGGTLAYTTKASYVLQIPSGFSSYKGTLAVNKTSGLASGYTIKGRLKIGSLLSNEISCVGPATSASGTVTVSGITGGTQITVEVQLFIDNTNDLSHTCPASVSFGHNEYLDQDLSNLQ